MSRALVSAQLALLGSTTVGVALGAISSVFTGPDGSAFVGLISGLLTFGLLSVLHAKRQAERRLGRALAQSMPEFRWTEPQDVGLRPRVPTAESTPSLRRIDRDPANDGFTVWVLDSRDTPVECVATYDGTWPTVPWRLTPKDAALRADWWVDDLFSEEDWFDRRSDAMREKRRREILS